MNEHTPGPWVTDGAHVTSRVGPSQRTVCELSTAAPAKGERYNAKAHVPELLANARLIAAAPDLLRELENVVRQADANPFLAVGMLVEHHSGIRAAIAKATGDES